MSDIEERILQCVAQNPGVPQKAVVDNIRPRQACRQAVWGLVDEGALLALRRRYAGSSLFLFLSEEGALRIGAEHQAPPEDYFPPVGKVPERDIIKPKPRPSWLQREDVVLRAILELLQAGLQRADIDEIGLRMRTLSEACGWYDRKEVEKAVREYLGVQL